MSTAAGEQPVRESQQLSRHRRKGPHLARRLTAFAWRQYTGHDRLLVHVQTTTPLMNDLHSNPFGKCDGREGTFIQETASRAPSKRGNRRLYPRLPRSNYDSGSKAP